MCDRQRLEDFSSTLRVESANCKWNLDAARAELIRLQETVDTLRREKAALENDSGKKRLQVNESTQDLTLSSLLRHNLQLRQKSVNKTRATMSLDTRDCNASNVSFERGTFLRYSQVLHHYQLVHSQ